MKNKRVKGLGIALSAALILGCTAPVAAAQMDGLQENSAVQTSTQTEEATSESSQSPTEKQEISVKETSEEKEAKKEEAGGQEQQTVSDTEKVPVSAAEVTEIPEETPDPTEVPEETPDPTVIPEKTLDSTAVPEETPESAAVPGEASGSTSAPEETPAPTATPAPEETPAPTPEEEQIQLPQVEQGWATGRESEDSDRVLWVLYKDGQIQQIWSWEQTGTWLQYDVEDTQLTEPAVPADGWYEIGSRKFLLKKGVPQTGWQANENGTGWYYCTDEAGSDGMGRGAAADPATMTGIRQINGSTYYLNADGTFRKNTTVDQDGTRYVLGTDGKVTKSYKPVTEQWMQNGNGWWYQHEDGTYPKNCWERIGGRLYSFDASGYMRSGGWYYLTGRGAMATGWLQLGDDWYYLGSDGAMYANRWYGNYYLTADGTWDPDREGDQLDTLLQQVIDQVTTQAMSQEGKLRACYDYVVNTFSYERKYNFSNAAGWQRQYALEMLTKGRGNCYNFAATFGCLAEKLGYSNVRTIAGMTGKAGGGWTPHSWVEIDMNGTTYIFDPEMEHANGYDLWKKTYATSPLRYQKF